MRDTDKQKARFITLSWQLLEHKCRYYMFNSPSIQDFEFDKLEAEYRQLAQELGLEPTASDMVDFDTSRPSCQRVYEKISKEFLKSKKKRRKVKA